jgi:SWI/SNF-related matrix-associated actin-dependent regulator 1 of chromatin subfamily A
LLIGDEMGLGKTVQAIALACYYFSEWPLLIICPSALKEVWKNV